MGASVLRSPETRSDTVIDALREAILVGRYGPGARLVQDDLAAAFGISRIPLREALRRLEGEGLITMSPNRGAVVRSLSPKDVVDLYDLRLALETLAVQRAAGRYADMRTRTRERHEQALRAVDGGMLSALFHLDRDYHAGIAQASDNPHLVGVLDGQWSQIMRVMHAFLKLSNYPPAVWDDHEAIAEAIAHGDGAAAVERLQRHLIASRDHILRHLRTGERA